MKNTLSFIMLLAVMVSAQWGDITNDLPHTGGYCLAADQYAAYASDSAGVHGLLEGDSHWFMNFTVDFGHSDHIVQAMAIMPEGVFLVTNSYMLLRYKYHLWDTIQCPIIHIAYILYANNRLFVVNDNRNKRSVASSSDSGRTWLVDSLHGWQTITSMYTSTAISGIVSVAINDSVIVARCTGAEVLWVCKKGGTWDSIPSSMIGSVQVIALSPINVLLAASGNLTPTGVSWKIFYNPLHLADPVSVTSVTIQPVGHVVINQAAMFDISGRRVSAAVTGMVCNQSLRKMVVAR